MDKGNPGENSRKKTKSQNDNRVSIHTSREEIEDNNVNIKEQGSNVSEGPDHLSSYSSKVRSDDEEYSSDHGDRGKGRYKDLLNSVQEEMGPPIENVFAEVYGERQNEKVVQTQGMN